MTENHRAFAGISITPSHLKQFQFQRQRGIPHQDDRRAQLIKQ